MKYFLSILLLASCCAVQAAPMAEFSKAIEASNVNTVKSLLQQNTLTEPEALELLNLANLILGMQEKSTWSTVMDKESTIRFYMGMGYAFAISRSLSNRAKLYLSVMGLLMVGSWALLEYNWRMSGKTKLLDTYTSAIAIQHLIYKASLDAQYPVKAQA